MQQREIYQRGLKYFELSEMTKSILKPIIAGDDKATDFEDCLKTDASISRQIILDANLQIKNGSVQSLSHAVVLIGKNRVRDFIFANSILACTIKDQDLIFQKILKEKNLLKYAEESESATRKLGADFAGGAWAAGFLFDFLGQLLAHYDDKKVFDESFKQHWAHGIKTAALAWSFANISKLSGSLCRQAFLGGLSHDIGRVVMWLSFPNESSLILKDFTRCRNSRQWENILEIEIERRHLGFTHTEIGSQLLVVSDFMSEVEEIVAFHHDVELLVSRASKAAPVVQCVNLADHLIERMSENPKWTNEEISKSLTSFKVPTNINASNISGVLDSLKSKQLL